MSEDAELLREFSGDRLVGERPAGHGLTERTDDQQPVEVTEEASATSQTPASELVPTEEPEASSPSQPTEEALRAAERAKEAAERAERAQQAAHRAQEAADRAARRAREAQPADKLSTERAARDARMVAERAKQVAERARHEAEAAAEAARLAALGSPPQPVSDDDVFAESQAAQQTAEQAHEAARREREAADRASADLRHESERMRQEAERAEHQGQAVGKLVGIIAGLFAPASVAPAPSRTHRDAVDADGTHHAEPLSDVRPAQRHEPPNVEERLTADGHEVLLVATDEIDIVTLKDGVVYFIDNKALASDGTVSSVAPLTSNFARNKASVVAELRHLLERAQSEQAMTTLASALTAIGEAQFRRVVTNANVANARGRVPTAVTDRLARQGIEFLDVVNS